VKNSFPGHLLHLDLAAQASSGDQQILFWSEMYSGQPLGISQLSEGYLLTSTNAIDNMQSYGSMLLAKSVTNPNN
jgi:hypothetical protein